MNFFWRFFIPAKFRHDMIEYARAKTVVIISMAGSITAFFYFLIFLLLGYVDLSFYIAGLSIFLFLSSFIVKYFGQVSVAREIMVAAITIVLVWLSLHLGGIYSSSILWLIVAPLLTVIAGGLRSGVLWAMFTALIISMFFYFRNVISTSMIFDISYVTLLLISLVGLVTFLTVIASYANSIKDDSLNMYYQTSLDDLTGAYNRASFQAFLTDLLGLERRKKTFLVGVDIDNFGMLNTMLGFDYGDIVLRKMYDLLADIFPNKAYICRFGSDEFNIVVRAESLSNVNHMVHQLHQRVGFIFLSEKYKSVSITCATGVVVLRDIHNYEEAIRRMNLALQKAKNIGENQSQNFDSELFEFEHRQLLMQALLPKAIANRQFRVQFYPRYKYVDGEQKLVAMALSAIWHHPELGDITPLEFIPIANRLGVLSDICNWVMTHALKQYRTWVSEEIIDESVKISVNCLAIQAEKGRFLDFLVDVSAKESLPVSIYEIEVPPMMVPNASLAVDLKRFVSLGGGIVLTDFGGSELSFKQVHALPFTGVILSDGLIRVDDRGHKMTEAVIALAHEYGVTVTAADVWSQDELTYLRAQQCDYFQGEVFQGVLFNHKV